MSASITRRTFAAGAVAGAAGLALSGSAIASEPAWDAEYDIVVVGSGFAGMVAGIAAREREASVVVVEKLDHPGGNSILCDSNAQFGGGTSVQVTAGIEDTPEAFYNEMMAHGGYRSVPALLQTFVDHSVEMVDWMQNLGFVFNETLKQQEMLVMRTHSAAPYKEKFGGLAMWLALNDIYEGLGGEVQLSHRVTQLVQDADGTVVGVEMDVNGTPVRYRAAKGVILASGGWKGNVGMRTTWDPRWDADVASSGWPCTENTGEMTNAAVDAGGTVCDMCYIGETLFQFGSDHMVEWSGSLDEMPEYYTIGLLVDPTYAIFVDGNGKRFVDETYALDYGSAELPDAYLNLPDRPRNVWAITDAAGAAAMEWTDEMFDDPANNGSRILTPGRVARAETLEELASTIGVDLEGLSATLATYNGYVQAGEDADFGKVEMAEIGTGPFYAAKFQLYCHDQMNGVVANTKGRVVKRSATCNPNGYDLDAAETVPHLYAAGECVGGYWGNSRGHGKIASYMIQGRLAAYDAAEQDAR